MMRGPQPASARAGLHNSGVPAPVSVLTLARYESWDFVPWSLFDVESLAAFEEVNDLI